MMLEVVSDQAAVGRVPPRLVAALLAVMEPDEAATSPGVESTSPTSMLAESLGATVVEERPHE